MRMPRRLSPAPIRHGEGAPCPVRRKERLRSQREGALVWERRLQHTLRQRSCAQGMEPVARQLAQQQCWRLANTNCQQLCNHWACQRQSQHQKGLSNAASEGGAEGLPGLGCSLTRLKLPVCHGDKQMFVLGRLEGGCQVLSTCWVQPG